MAESVIFKCPNCASPLRLEDWNTSTGIIKCSYCRAFSTMPGQRTEVHETPPALRARGDVPQPPGLTVEELATGLVISRRWFTLAVIFLVPFCLVWNGFLIFWYTMAFTTNAPLIMKLFPTLHLAVGAFLTYFTIATIFNVTRIRVGNGRIQIRHQPIPWMGNLDISTDELEQLYCKERIRSSKNGTRYTYEVWATLRDGKSRKIVSVGDMNQDQALFIEQRIERALGIADKPIPGELSR